MGIKVIYLGLFFTLSLIPASSLGAARAPEPGMADVNSPAKNTDGILFVDVHATGAQLGSSWPNAFTDLQEALALARPGDRIHVAQGVYRPTEDARDRHATFGLPDGVTLLGGYAGNLEKHRHRRDIRRFPTILSGDIDHNDDQGDLDGNSFVVVTCLGVKNSAVLDGLTITGGYGHNHPALAATDVAAGAGFVCRQAGAPRLVDCVFRSNHAELGGAAYLSGKCHASFIRCLWEGNSARDSGGALAVHNAGVTLSHCILRNNAAGRHGGTVDIRGTGSRRFINCLLTANSAANKGGAIRASGNTDSRAEQALAVVNCTFFGNTAPTYFQASGPALIVNCLFHRALVTEAANTSREIEAGPEVKVLATLHGQAPTEDTPAAAIRDPLFVMPLGRDGILGTDDDDFRLSPGSPAIDAGVAISDPLMATRDLDGNPRIINGIIDMGAYEFWDVIYVDDNAPSDPGPHDPWISDPDEDGSIKHPFDSVTEAIHEAKRFQPAPDGTLTTAQQNRRTIVVAPGRYAPQFPQDSIQFTGHNLRLIGSRVNDFSVVEKTILGYSVIFQGTEDARCELAGLTFQHRAFGGIFGNDTNHPALRTRATLRNCMILGNKTCDGTVLSHFAGLLKNCLIAGNRSQSNGECGQRPVVYDFQGTMQNCTITENHIGVHLNAGKIVNSIIYGNRSVQVIMEGYRPVNITYSNIEGGRLGIVDSFYFAPIPETSTLLQWGPGNVDVDPHFARRGHFEEINGIEIFIPGDYHLQSQGWRWQQPMAEHGPRWTFDDQTSPCIDAGDPTANLEQEPTHIPVDPQGEYGSNQGLNMGAYGGTSQASMAPNAANDPENETRPTRDAISVTDSP